MSGRIASLIGVDDSGDLVSVGMGRNDTMTRLLEVRKEIQAANGLWKKGSREVKLTELFLLANSTAGGELKARLKFR